MFDIVALGDRNFKVIAQCEPSLTGHIISSINIPKTSNVECCRMDNCGVIDFFSICTFDIKDFKKFAFHENRQFLYN